MTDQRSAEADLLTPAASEALSEFIDDFRVSLLRRAAASARRSGSPEITVSDLARAFEDERQPRRRLTTSRSRLQRLALVYALLGVLVALTGGITVLASRLDEANLSPRTEFGYIALVAGATIGTLAVLLAVKLRLTESARDRYALRSNAIEAEFIMEWSDFEIEARAAISDRLGESAISPLHLTELLERLATEGLITPDEQAVLRNVLRTRNAVVHGLEANPEDVEQSLALVARVTERLRRR